MLNKARENKENSYSPYSNFKVGAILKTKEGKEYSGTNIENVAYFSCCAERLAFYKAIEQGEKNFESIAIYGDKNPCYPCGTCRQLMSEFCDENFKIITTKETMLLKDLFPKGFKNDRNNK